MGILSINTKKHYFCFFCTKIMLQYGYENAKNLVLKGERLL
ncbi:MAG: hypothetical protein RI894_498 [Bacteroidota bacterium]